MLLFYIEDSGDPGLMSQRSPTKAFVLSALIVKDSDWLSTLDEIVNFRHFLRDNFGLRMRDELKAGYLIHGTGAFSRLGLGDRVRTRIYSMALKFQQKVSTLTTWAVVIDKHKWESQGHTGGALAIRELAWRRMFERIERYTHYAPDHGIIIPDEGHPAFVQALFRKSRRYNPVGAHFTGGSLNTPAVWTVEDPNFRQSHQSYYLQLADLNAYAAYRHIFPEPWFGSSFWDVLGSARELRVNRLRGIRPAGIVLEP